MGGDSSVVIGNDGSPVAQPEIADDEIRASWEGPFTEEEIAQRKEALHAYLKGE